MWSSGCLFYNCCSNAFCASIEMRGEVEWFCAAEWLCYWVLCVDGGCCYYELANRVFP